MGLTDFFVATRGRRRVRARPPYAQTPLLAGMPWLGHVLIFVVCLAYGHVYATQVAAGSSPTPFLAPLGVIAALIIWVMPQISSPPYAWIDRFLIAFLFALFCWPDYLALDLPGLPWITAVRLTSFPLTALMLYALFGSPAARVRLRTIMSGSPYVAWGVVVFIALAGLSIAMSKDIPGSSNRYFIALTTWLVPFGAALFYFSQERSARRLAIYLTGFTILSILIGMYEARYAQLPWKNRIPSFLAVPDERVDALLQGIVRAADGIYRVQSRFSTSIGLGEFFGMALPFMLHLMMKTRRAGVRLLILSLLPPMFYVVLRTGSRLALIAYISSVALYILFFALRRWVRRRDSLIAPAIVLAYPAVMGLFIIASFLWRRLEVAIWGGGSAAPSTEARRVMVQMAIPLIERNPIGYGIGRAAETLGFIQPGTNILSIDSYFLSVVLEFGVVGFIIYYGIFVWAAGQAAVTAFRSSDEDISYLAAASIAIVNFLISKTIYSQQENHPLAFILLGFVVALCWREGRKAVPRLTNTARPRAAAIV
ncbi:MAG: O-antigen ligase family protein [Sphingomonas sp.]|uniref:O-antigen ligase family protein n=1 Tax=Sphingomonas sp. TaxID=28214 RepID=UPI0025DF3D23|nr:O-antigen ligase family protein [Sphingomonas sp.]MBX9881845.1 O-antigen ligase family protein [Sphingomonas sp.]